MRRLPFLLVILVSSFVSAEVYKCRLSDGSVEISNKPCKNSSNTLVVRPDEPVSESNRQQAERDVERMREYIERQEAAQRAVKSAEPARQSSTKPPSAAPNHNYGDPESCLRDLEQQILEASQRAALEAECRSRSQQRIESPAPIYPPSYGGNSLNQCIAAVQMMRVSPSEQQRMIHQCEAGHGVSATPLPLPQLKPTPPPHSAPMAPTIPFCPPNNKNCSR